MGLGQWICSRLQPEGRDVSILAHPSNSLILLYRHWIQLWLPGKVGEHQPCFISPQGWIPTVAPMASGAAPFPGEHHQPPAALPRGAGLEGAELSQPAATSWPWWPQPCPHLAMTPGLGYKILPQKIPPISPQTALMKHGNNPYF